MKTILVLSILSLLTLANSYASTRIDSVIESDANDRLNRIETIQNEIKELEMNRDKLEATIKHNLETQGKLITIRNVSVGIGAISYAAALFLDKNFNFIPNVEHKMVYSAYGILLGSFAALGTEAGVILTQNEAKKLLQEVLNLKIQLQNAQVKLEKESRILCKSEPTHQLCY